MGFYVLIIFTFFKENLTKFMFNYFTKESLWHSLSDTTLKHLKCVTKGMSTVACDAFKLFLSPFTQINLDLL